MIGGDQKKDPIQFTRLDEPSKRRVEARDRLDVPLGPEVMSGAVDGPDVHHQEEGARSHRGDYVGGRIEAPGVVSHVPGNAPLLVVEGKTVPPDREEIG